MGLELVRQASKVLGPLLRRRGTSPALGASLRKALGLLDKILGGLDGQRQEETVRAGVAELKVCLALIDASDRAADHEQGDGIRKVLAILAPEEAAAPASETPAVPLLDLAVAQVEPSPQGPVERPRRAVRAVTAVPVATLDQQVAGLAMRIHFLHVTLSAPLFKLGDALAADADVRKQAQAMRWLGRERVPELLRMIDAPGSSEDRVVLAGALALLGTERAAEWLVTVLERLVAAQQPLPDLSTTLLRALCSPGFLDAIAAEFRKPANPVVRSLVLPLLVEHGLLPLPALRELVLQPSDDVAISAAHALVGFATADDTPALLGQVTKARTARRAHALLFAAAVLGSGEALREIRARLQGSEPVDFQLVEALAVAGNEGDASLLLALAAREDTDADRLVLAAAHLGSPATLDELPALSEHISPQVMAEATRMIAGTDAARTRALDPNLRYLCGKPWTVGTVLARLADEHEPIQSQQRLALDLRARTGLPLPAVLPLYAPLQGRQELVSEWASHFAKYDRLRPGDWYCQGKPVVQRAATS